MLHIKLRESSLDKHRSKHVDLTQTPDLWVMLKSDIESVQIIFYLKLVERLLILICMIPKVSLGVGKTGFM